jgi:hypothetical protein
MLIPTLLGQACFAAMPEAVRRVHGGQSGVWRGTSMIERGSGLISRVCGFFARLPRAAQQVETVVRIDVSSHGEHWQRRFGDSLMPSRLSVHLGLLRERLGPVRFDFLLVPELNGFRWQVKKVAVFGVPLPAVWFKQVHAFSFSNALGYAFEVSASLPVVGFIVRYRGNLA